jgi:hypothetical protein
MQVPSQSTVRPSQRWFPHRQGLLTIAAVLVEWGGILDQAAAQAACLQWAGFEPSPVLAVDRLPQQVLLCATLGPKRLAFATDSTASGSLGQSEVWAYTGSGYEPVGRAVPLIVPRLAEIDLGSGPELYLFGKAQGEGMPLVYRYDGQDFVPVGPGFSVRGFLGTSVSTVGAFDFGDGPELVIGGTFGTGTSLQSIARRHQGAWAPLPAPFTSTGTVFSFLADFAVADLGGGPRLIAVGIEPGSTSFVPLGISYSATGFELLSLPAAISPQGLVEADFGLGPRVYLTTTQELFAFDGTQWSPLGLPALGPGVLASKPLRVPDFFNDGQRLLLDFQSALGGPSGPRWLFAYDGSRFVDLDAGALDKSSQTISNSLAFGSPYPGQPVQLLCAGGVQLAGGGGQGLVSFACPPLFTVLKGCQPKRLALSSPSTEFAIGNPVQFELAGFPLQTGLVQLWQGVPARDGAGCGLLSPLLGEVLIGAGSPIAGTTLAGGSAHFQLGVSMRPGLVRLELAFQAFFLSKESPDATFAASNALVGTIGP